MADRAKYLQSSPIQSDYGSEIGRNPTEMPLADLVALGHPQSPIKAIRAKCVDCSGGDMAEARKCKIYRCPLWPLRMGTNVFHKSSKKGGEGDGDG